MRSPRSWRLMRRLGVIVAILSAPIAWVTSAPASPALGAVSDAHIERASQPLPRARSSGCGTPATAGTSTQTIDVQGVSRQYRFAVPSEPTGKRPLPLIINFHGANSKDVGQAVYSQLEEKGPARGFVVLTPNAGVPPIWDDPATRSARTYVEASDANFAFTTALIDNAEARLCINVHRVYATGFSNGAGMSAYLGCKLSRQLAAIAPVSGVNLAAPCPHGRPISVIAFHGTEDGSVTFEGGVSPEGRPGVELPPVESAMGVWAQRAGCRTKPERQSIETEVQRIAYSGCRRATGVVLYEVTGGGHTWPGTSIDVPRNGHTTQDINAADLILDFFAHHPEPAKKAKS
jgi:polyhydroxybutyrate depolymerase